MVCYPWVMAGKQPIAKRPRPQVPARQRRFVGRRVADVHGRRQDVPLATPDRGILSLVDWLTPSFYIDFGRPCNSACLYCAVPPHEDAQGFLPLADVDAIIAAGMAAQCDRAILIGGEPTIYPQLWDVLDKLRSAGLDSRHIVMTNGMKLSDPDFASRLVSAGVGVIHFSLDTADALVYDRLSRSEGRHSKQLAGLDVALRQTDAQMYVYTAVTRLNAAGLPALAELIAHRAELAGRPPPGWVLAVIKPIGDGLRHADVLQLSPTEATAAVRDAMARADELGIAVGHRNLQACLAPDLVARNIDYYLDDFSVDVQTGARVTYSHTEYWHKPATCGSCAHESICTGIYREMELRFGVQPYQPIGPVGLRRASCGDG